MKLGKKQELFARLYAEHLVWLHSLPGHETRLGDVFASTGHKVNSNHYKKLAGDINLFVNGEYITTTEGHRESGEMWETRHKLCRWGGRFDDGNHYSLLHKGSM